MLKNLIFSSSSKVDAYYDSYSNPAIATELLIFCGTNGINSNWFAVIVITHIDVLCDNFNKIYRYIYDVHI